MCQGTVEGDGLLLLPCLVAYPFPRQGIQRAAACGDLAAAELRRGTIALQAPWPVPRTSKELLGVTVMSKKSLSQSPSKGISVVSCRRKGSLATLGTTWWREDGSPSVDRTSVGSRRGFG